jgi:hypothetical protein
MIVARGCQGLSGVVEEFMSRRPALPLFYADPTRPTRYLASRSGVCLRVLRNTQWHSSLRLIYGRNFIHTDCLLLASNLDVPSAFKRETIRARRLSCLF